MKPRQAGYHHKIIFHPVMNFSEKNLFLLESRPEFILHLFSTGQFQLEIVEVISYIPGRGTDDYSRNFGDKLAFGRELGMTEEIKKQQIGRKGKNSAYQASPEPVSEGYGKNGKNYEVVGGYPKMASQKENDQSIEGTGSQGTAKWVPAEHLHYTLTELGPGWP